MYGKLHYLFNYWGINYRMYINEYNNFWCYWFGDWSFIGLIVVVILFLKSIG